MKNKFYLYVALNENLPYFCQFNYVTNWTTLKQLITLFNREPVGVNIINHQFAELTIKARPNLHPKFSFVISLNNDINQIDHTNSFFIWINNFKMLDYQGRTVKYLGEINPFYRFDFNHDQFNIFTKKRTLFFKSDLYHLISNQNEGLKIDSPNLVKYITNISTYETGKVFQVYNNKVVYSSDIYDYNKILRKPLYVQPGGLINTIDVVGTFSRENKTVVTKTKTKPPRDKISTPVYQPTQPTQPTQSTPSTQPTQSTPSTQPTTPRSVVINADLDVFTNLTTAKIKNYDDDFYQFYSLQTCKYGALIDGRSVTTLKLNADDAKDDIDNYKERYENDEYNTDTVENYRACHPNFYFKYFAYKQLTELKQVHNVRDNFFICIVANIKFKRWTVSPRFGGRESNSDPIYTGNWGIFLSQSGGYTRVMYNDDKTANANLNQYFRLIFSYNEIINYLFNEELITTADKNHLTAQGFTGPVNINNITLFAQALYSKLIVNNSGYAIKKES